MKKNRFFTIIDQHHWLNSDDKFKQCPERKPTEKVVQLRSNTIVYLDLVQPWKRIVVVKKFGRETSLAENHSQSTNLHYYFYTMTPKRILSLTQHILTSQELEIVACHTSNSPDLTLSTSVFYSYLQGQISEAVENEFQDIVGCRSRYFTTNKLMIF